MNAPVRLLLLGGRASLRDALARCCAGGDMAEAADAGAALAQVRATAGAQPPRLIVVDAEVAGATATVAALKTDPQAALVPLVVVCAAAADAAVVETFYRAGANACVRLPDDAAAIEAVAAALAGFWLGANEVPPSLS